MNSLIEKVLYLAPQCRYSGLEFTGQLSYSEILDLSGHVIPIATAKSSSSSGIVLLYSHANAEDISQLRSFSKWLCRSLYCDVVVYDYPGYGRSTGAASEVAIKECGYRVAEYLIDEMHVDPSRLVLFGHSLGSAVSVFVSLALLERRNIHIAGLILQSCFQSIYSVALNFRQAPKHDLYVTRDLISQVKFPVCLIHGRNDPIVPISHAKRLFCMIPKEYRFKCFFVENAGHNNIEYSCVKRSDYCDFINDFFVWVKSVVN